MFTIFSFGIPIIKQNKIKTYFECNVLITEPDLKKSTTGKHTVQYYNQDWREQGPPGWAGPDKDSHHQVLNAYLLQPDMHHAATPSPVDWKQRKKPTEAPTFCIF